MATVTTTLPIDKSQTHSDWKARYLRNYFGQVTAITPENGLMKITVSNHLGSMDFHADPRSRFVVLARAAMLHLRPVQDVTYRKSQRWAGERGHHTLVPSFEIVDMVEARR